MEGIMTETKKADTKSKPAEPKKSANELDEKELQKVSGGACAGGKHLPEGTIIH
jgi:bacteriocin-like protein